MRNRAAFGQRYGAAGPVGGLIPGSSVQFRRKSTFGENGRQPAGADQLWHQGPLAFPGGWGRLQPDPAGGRNGGECLRVAQQCVPSWHAGRHGCGGLYRLHGRGLAGLRAGGGAGAFLDRNGSRAIPDVVGPARRGPGWLHRGAVGGSDRLAAAGWWGPVESRTTAGDYLLSWVPPVAAPLRFLRVRATALP